MIRSMEWWMDPKNNKGDIFEALCIVPSANEDNIKLIWRMNINEEAAVNEPHQIYPFAKLETINVKINEYYVNPVSNSGSLVPLSRVKYAQKKAFGIYVVKDKNQYVVSRCAVFKTRPAICQMYNPNLSRWTEHSISNNIIDLTVSTTGNVMCFNRDKIYELNKYAYAELSKREWS